MSLKTSISTGGSPPYGDAVNTAILDNAYSVADAFAEGMDKNAGGPGSQKWTAAGPQAPTSFVGVHGAKVVD